MDVRLLAGARLLAQHGLEHVSLEARGFQGEIAALGADPVALPQLQALVPRFKALGFRYVALDLLPPAEGADA